jgi:hypothetical protein
MFGTLLLLVFNLCEHISVRICLLHGQVLLLKIYEHLALIVNIWQKTFLFQILKTQLNPHWHQQFSLSLSRVVKNKLIDILIRSFVCHNDNFFFHFHIKLFFISCLYTTIQELIYTHASDSPTCRYSIDLHPRRKSSV